MLLEITAEGWVAIIGAVAAAITVLAAAITSVIIAWGNSKKLDVAASRREEIKDELKP